MDNRLFLNLAILRADYEITFQTMLDNHKLKNREYKQASKHEKYLEHRIMWLKRRLDLLAKDPCQGQPCHQCIYHTNDRGGRGQCNVEKNRHDNNGLFKGFSPKPEYKDWRKKKYEVYRLYQSRHSKRKLKIARDFQRAKQAGRVY